MNIKKLKENWNKFGMSDPLWSILTDPRKKGNKWRIDEFFESGREEINSVIQYIDSLNVTLQRDKALDFGCGAGRLTQAIAAYFNEVYGVDIAKSMIELAKKHNRYGEKCKYILNDENNLNLFANDCFDFIYSNIVLQHMKPKYSKAYISEFMRIMKPHGLLVFQHPSREKQKFMEHSKIFRIKKYLKNVLPSELVDLYRNKILAEKGEGPVMEMYEMKRKDVVSFLREIGAIILDISEDKNWSTDWISYRYCVTKNNRNI